MEVARGVIKTRLGEPPAPLLREALVRLGPAFVKIGQAISSRPDILPQEYLQVCTFKHA